MHKLISWYNTNRRRIWAILIAAIIIIAIVYYIIYTSSENNVEYGQSGSSTNVNTINNELNSTTLSSTDSAVTGSTASTTTDEIKVIDNFIEYCNNQELEKAYNLLSDECKDEMYPELENFETSYYDQVFGGSTKTVTMENWFGNTYKVDFNNDFLATGVYDTENTLQDYITIVKDSNGDYKLNINDFVKRTSSNKSASSNGITVIVVEINTYMDYEIYEFQIVNNTDNTVLMGNLDEEDTMYLQDTNDNKYTAYIHELTKTELTVNSGQTKNLKIKYYNKYSSSKNITYAVFSKILLNYDTYGTDGESRKYASIYIDL